MTLGLNNHGVPITCLYKSFESVREVHEIHGNYPLQYVELRAGEQILMMESVNLC